MGDPRRLEIAPHQAGERLDRLLASELGIARAAVRRLLERGAVRLGDRVLSTTDKGRVLSAGVVLEIAPFAPPGSEVPAPAPDLRLRVLAEGPGWIALDKPAGVAVHPLREDEGGTLLGALAQRHPGIVGVGEGGLRSGVVHRLDVDTSGAVLFALEAASWERLRAAFAEHRMRKVYHAVVAGMVREPFSQRLALRVARHRPARVRVVAEEGSDAPADARVIEQAVTPLEAWPEADATLVEIRPKTGFLHQIRVTLAHVGHPLLGDATYAPQSIAARAPRHLLHASAVGFEEIDARCDWAGDFAAAVEAARAARGPARD